MPDLSAHLGLAKPSTLDDFDTAEIASNWQIVDDHPGRFITDLAGVAAVEADWGAANEGMEILVIDAVPFPLVWYWDGAAFSRDGGPYAVGLLAAPTTRTSDFTTTNTTPQVVVSVDVDVPEGGRSIEIQASWPSAHGDDGAVQFALYQDTNQLSAWKVHGTTGGTLGPELGTGGAMTFIDTPADGAYTYSLRAGVPVTLSNEITVEGGADHPIAIWAKEI